MKVLKGVVALTLAVAAAASSSAYSFVSFNGTRGGNSALNSAAGYAATRTALSGFFPGSTFTGVSTLTSANLATADVLWIGSTFTGVQAISPLTASEQTAMVNFVLGGGQAMIFVDNSTFAGNADAVNQSLIAPFGAVVAGTGPATATHTILAPGADPANGHFGNAGATLQSQFPGWFTTVPSQATPIATVGANQPSILKFDFNAIAPGSGRVWMFSESGYQTTGGVAGSGWNTLYGNMLYKPVPEPTTLVATCLGVCLLARRRARR